MNMNRIITILALLTYLLLGPISGQAVEMSYRLKEGERHLLRVESETEVRNFHPAFGEEGMVTSNFSKLDYEMMASHVDEEKTTFSCILKSYRSKVVTSMGEFLFDSEDPKSDSLGLMRQLLNQPLTFTLTPKGTLTLQGEDHCGLLQKEGVLLLLEKFFIPLPEGDISFGDSCHVMRAPSSFHFGGMSLGLPLESEVSLRSIQDSLATISFNQRGRMQEKEITNPLLPALHQIMSYDTSIDGVVEWNLKESLPTHLFLEERGEGTITTTIEGSGESKIPFVMKNSYRISRL